MKSLKSLQTLTGLMLVSRVLSSQHDIPSDRLRNNLRPEDIDMTPRKKIIPKGCKIFIINGVEIVSINEKTAQKKYQKQFGIK